jgi:hypothetical protein
LLAAYRRDDWPTSELSALRRHLESCAACRQAEADYRRVGEQIRRLPSRTPPSAFRAAVIAAIVAEQRRVAPVIARLSRAATSPALPVVRPASRPPRRADLRVGLRAALVAAALVLVFLGIRAVPGFSALSRIAGSLPAPNDAQKGNAQAPAPASYSIPGGYTDFTTALATGAWLAYGADDRAAHITLFAERRQDSAPARAFFNGEVAQLPTIRGLSDDWVLWTTGSETSGLWTLYARRLPLEGSSNTLLLSSSVGDFATLSGIWTRGDIALVTGATAYGATELVRIDLVTGAQTVLASAPAGQLFTDPAALNDAYYWADVTLDPLNGLSSTLQRLDTTSGNTSAPVVTATTCFALAATRSTLVWVDVPRASLRMQTASADALTPSSEAELSYSLAGALRVQSGGMTLADDALVASMQAGGNLVIWQASVNLETRADMWYSFDLATHGASPWSRALSAAAAVAITDSAVVWWNRPDATTLYVAPTQ